MKPRPLPKSFPDAQWQSWPTLDDLRVKRPDMKLHRLRAMLADVTCYRCKDGSVRYVQDELDELIEDEEELDERTREVVGDDGKLSPQLFEMVMFRESMRAVSEVTKALSELRRMIGDISAAATSPLTLGIDLLRQATERDNARLRHYEEQQDNTLALYEALASMQTDRDLKVERAKGAAVLRQQAVGALMSYAPQFLKDLKQSAVSNPAAAAAYDAVSSLEPEVLDAIVDANGSTPEQRAAWTRLRELIKQGQQGQQGQQSNHHAPS